MGGFNFMEWLGIDLSVKVLLCLDDPSDIIRVSAVSSHWRQFIINNGICKQLCMKLFPEMSTITCAIGVESMIEPADVLSDECNKEWTSLIKEHRVYAFLARGLDPCVRNDCISEAIRASSTDNYPEETISNTLIPGDKVGQRASYWSSKGSNDPAVLETLTYKLASKLCVVTEIHIHPFQAFFQFGFPIYSAKAVRFLMGHPKVGKEVESGECDEFVWTCVSPDFPMTQDNKLQKFKLPEPVICIGGILQVQLLGRVQRQEMDGLYYICICNVQVLGRPLSSDFDVEILDQTGKCAVKYCPECHSLSKNCCPRGESSNNPSQFQRLSAGIRGWEQMILNTLLGAGAVVVDDLDDDIDQLG